MQKLIKLSPLQESMLGKEYVSHTGSVVTVVGVSTLPMENTKTKRNKTWYYVLCSTCHRDKELWGDEPITTMKGSLEKGIFPCGCSLHPNFTEAQNRIRVIIRCKELNYEFIGWEGEYTTVSKTKINVFDNETNTYHTFGSILVFMVSKGLSRERRNIQLRNRDCVNTKDGVQLLIDGNPKYPAGTKVLGKNLERDSYWDISCPSCSSDEYVTNHLCSGVFTLFKGDIDKGIIPCRCSGWYRWNTSQREYQISKIMSDIDGRFLEWSEGTYHRRSSKFSWVCCRGHTATKDVLSFIRGSRCAVCYKEDKNYGYYPMRGQELDNLYLMLMSDGNESFYKIGRSFNVTVRLNKFSETYNCSVISTFAAKHERIFMLEQCLHRLLKEFHYSPLLYFKGGKSECFTKDVGDIAEVVSIFNLKQTS